jgi:molybdopterin/thiamine biosynthesis adenylyltransferase
VSAGSDFATGDVISAHNLNRQYLHTPADIGRKKSESAYEKLRAFAPKLTLEPQAGWIDADKAPGLISRYHVVLLAVDTINASCHQRSVHSREDSACRCWCKRI